MPACSTLCSLFSSGKFQSHIKNGFISMRQLVVERHRVWKEAANIKALTFDLRSFTDRTTVWADRNRCVDLLGLRHRKHAALKDCHSCVMKIALLSIYRK